MRCASARCSCSPARARTSAAATGSARATSSGRGSGAARKSLPASASAARSSRARRARHRWSSKLAQTSLQRANDIAPRASVSRLPRAERRPSAAVATARPRLRFPVPTSAGHNAGMAEREAAAEREASQTEQVLRGRNRALQELARGAPLGDVLATLAKSAEECFPELRCSVLVLDETQHLRHGAAPSLPEFYSRAVDGMAIGAGLGSCGEAAALGKRVVVEDVLAHPNWAPFRELARRAEFRACWSEPVFSSQGEVLGTFAMYYAEPRSPLPPELDFITTTAHLAGIAIERKRQDARHRAQEERFRQVTESIREVFYLTEWHEGAEVKNVL